MGVAYKQVLTHNTALSSGLVLAVVSKAMPTLKVSLWRASLVDSAACPGMLSIDALAHGLRVKNFR